MFMCKPPVAGLDPVAQARAPQLTHNAREAGALPLGLVRLLGVHQWASSTALALPAGRSALLTRALQAYPLATGSAPSAATAGIRVGLPLLWLVNSMALHRLAWHAWTGMAATPSADEGDETVESAAAEASVSQLQQQGAYEGAGPAEGRAHAGQVLRSEAEETRAAEEEMAAEVEANVEPVSSVDSGARVLPAHSPVSPVPDASDTALDSGSADLYQEEEEEEEEDEDAPSSVELSDVTAPDRSTISLSDGEVFFSPADSAAQSPARRHAHAYAHAHGHTDRNVHSPDKASGGRRPEGKPGTARSPTAKPQRKAVAQGVKSPVRRTAHGSPEKPHRNAVEQEREQALPGEGTKSPVRRREHAALPEQGMTSPVHITAHESAEHMHRLPQATLSSSPRRRPRGEARRVQRALGGQQPAQSGAAVVAGLQAESDHAAMLPEASQYDSLLSPREQRVKPSASLQQPHVMEQHEGHERHAERLHEQEQPDQQRETVERPRRHAAAVLPQRQQMQHTASDRKHHAAVVLSPDSGGPTQQTHQEQPQQQQLNVTASGMLPHEMRVSGATVAHGGTTAESAAARRRPPAALSGQGHELAPSSPRSARHVTDTAQSLLQVEGAVVTPHGTSADVQRHSEQHDTGKPSAVVPHQTRAQHDSARETLPVSVSVAAHQRDTTQQPVSVLQQPDTMEQPDAALGYDEGQPPTEPQQATRQTAATMLAAPTTVLSQPVSSSVAPPRAHSPPTASHLQTAAQGRATSADIPAIASGSGSSVVSVPVPARSGGNDRSSRVQPLSPGHSERVQGRPLLRLQASSPPPAAWPPSVLASSFAPAWRPATERTGVDAGGGAGVPRGETATAALPETTGAGAVGGAGFTRCAATALPESAVGGCSYAGAARQHGRPRDDREQRADARLLQHHYSDVLWQGQAGPHHALPLQTAGKLGRVPLLRLAPQRQGASGSASAQSRPLLRLAASERPPPEQAYELTPSTMPRPIRPKEHAARGDAAVGGRGGGGGTEGGVGVGGKGATGRGAGSRGRGGHRAPAEAVVAARRLHRLHRDTRPAAVDASWQSVASSATVAPTRRGHATPHTAAVHIADPTRNAAATGRSVPAGPPPASVSASVPTARPAHPLHGSPPRDSERGLAVRARATQTASPDPRVAALGRISQGVQAATRSDAMQASVQAGEPSPSDGLPSDTALLPVSFGIPAMDLLQALELRTMAAMQQVATQAATEAVSNMNHPGDGPRGGDTMGRRILGDGNAGVEPRLPANVRSATAQTSHDALRASTAAAASGQPVSPTSPEPQLPGASGPRAATAAGAAGRGVYRTEADATPGGAPVQGARSHARLPAGEIHSDAAVAHGPHVMATYRFSPPSARRFLGVEELTERLPDLQELAHAQGLGRNGAWLSGTAHSVSISVASGLKAETHDPGYRAAVRRMELRHDVRDLGF